ncbi:hypothetical protein AC1031_005002 [Aphanomyces cochlioides]|nr:hypothetical protein AC1031_005002 [Aphanomyces cochlioides]
MTSFSYAKMMKRTIRDPAMLPAKVPVLYPRPEYSLPHVEYSPPQAWEQPPMMHQPPPHFSSSSSNGDHNETSYIGAKRRRVHVDMQETRRREDIMYPPPPVPYNQPAADSDVSSEAGDAKLEDDEPLKKLHGKKRNRMKDEIDALRKEIGSMTRHLDWLRQDGMYSRRQQPLWADIAKQQAHELSRATAENLHLRQTLEEHLDIAQEYIDTIIPKTPTPPPSPRQNPPPSSLPIIMCL